LPFSDSWVRVNPSLGEMGDKPFRFGRSFESIRQAADAMRMPPTIALPSDFSSSAPVFGPLVKRRISHNESIFIIQISHDGKNYTLANGVKP
jgi:hypothetical protein